jgi:hypothetical protein
MALISSKHNRDMIKKASNAYGLRLVLHLKDLSFVLGFAMEDIE